MKIGELKKILKEAGAEEYRFKQIRDAIYKRGVLDFSNMNIGAGLAEKLKKEFKISDLEEKRIDLSADKRSYKALLSAKDGNYLETVLISPRPGFWSACVSSQIGCKLGCRFCATGQGGFIRNLKSDEITAQILFWKYFLTARKIPGKFMNIVFMGMGEPFLNWGEVKPAIKDLIDPDLFNFAARHISVSTCGVPQGMRELARDFPQANLAVSLIFADNNTRSEFMPINRRYGLDQIRKALEDYLRKTNRKVFLEYILFQGINDRKSDVIKLAEFIRSIGDGRKLLHVNLICYNVAVSGLKPSEKKTAAEFKNNLLKAKIKVTIRKSLGADIDAACGQLASREMN